MSIKLWEEAVPQHLGEPDVIPSLTPFLLESDSLTSAMVICPGGGYGMRADHEGEPIAKWLNACGISAFVLNYRVAPHKHPAPLLDAQRALRYVRYHAEEWGIKKNKVGILGFSAGGHLAATVGTHVDEGDAYAEDPLEKESARPDVMVLCYPVITLQSPYRHEGSMINLLGEQPDEGLLTSLSNELQVSQKTPPTFLWHTADDDSVPVENSLLFARALSQAHVPFDLHIFEQGPHGMGLATEDEHVRQWQEQCASWLKIHQF
ncbi:acetylesterase [Pullulanibacillus camelliae]|uniref:Acetylesterase n=1 Tax=Pullulanibacillus camelliae TaxID=1707096 RepID=A0A8J3DXZ0_9BACL|nr:alpha/beta hydrolase [Pullulanibacillus camelliae]GGE49224.1 acetylesterase [Pullulanibacillus camelliae]